MSDEDGTPVDAFVGRRLRSLREKHSVSLHTISSLLKVDEALLTQIENGLARLGGDNIIKLCDLFEVAPSEFFPEVDS